MLKINENTIIFIICSGGYVSGGPEACHQLADKLIKFGHKAFIVYEPVGDSFPVPDVYKHYKVKTEKTIVDNENNILIAPETKTHYLKDYSKIQKAIWWLSIDNYFKASHTFKKVIIQILRKTNIFSRYKNYLKPGTSITHFAQSQYAINFLSSKKLPECFLLSDYLKFSFFEQKKSQKRENVILYNPQKGICFTEKLKKYSKNFIWKPIQGMSPEEVKNVFMSSKVYVDFGNHPGKDRFPREAIICGCCIITSMAGSAWFSQDVPIDLSYKFKIKNSNIKIIIELIDDIFKNFELHNKNFTIARQQILRQEEIFEYEVKNIFTEKN